MAGHVVKKHRRECASRREEGKRCNCGDRLRFEARYPDPTSPGLLSKKVTKTFRRERDARDWLATQRADVLSGAHVHPRTAERPFGEILDAWAESWAARLSPTTERRYRGIVDKYLRPEFGSRRVGSISHETIQRYVNRLASDPKRKPGTTRNVYAVLRTAFAYAVKINAVGSAP
jgi:hypothetical protein